MVWGLSIIDGRFVERDGGPYEFVRGLPLRMVRCGAPYGSSFLIDRDAFRGLPPVGARARARGAGGSVRTRGRAAVLRAVRAAIEEARRGLRADGRSPRIRRAWPGDRFEILENERASMRPVINATGVLLHTGLGRAPLAEEAIEAVAAVARGYCSLELELEDGERGRRTSGIERLVCELTRAEAATAVNNNAGATVLALKALAAGREVIVSRGELVEIGGSFRLPEILEVSGARLREVGTTNKTRLSDYERAIGPETAAILRVHRSNFQIVGFTEAPELSDLVRLAHDRGIWAIDDIGSGAIRADSCFLRPAMSRRPRQPSRPGPTWCLFSGDKLLGGPQCGVIAGTETAIDRIESDPLMRALRLDKMMLAALEATLAAGARPGASGARGFRCGRWSRTPVEVLSSRAIAIWPERCAIDLAITRRLCRRIRSWAAAVRRSSRFRRRPIAISAPFPAAARVGSGPGNGAAAG